MTTQHRLDPALRRLLAAARVVIVTQGLRLAADLVGLVCISVLLPLAILPVPSWMIRKGMPKPPAIALTLVIAGVGGRPTKTR